MNIRSFVLRKKATKNLSFPSSSFFFPAQLLRVEHSKITSFEHNTNVTVTCDEETTLNTHSIVYTF